MTIEEQLEYLVITLNLVEDCTTLEFNFREDVRKAFLLVYDQDFLQKSLQREHPNYYNKFCNMDSLLMAFIKKNNISLNIANEYLNKIENSPTRNWKKIELVRIAITQNQIEMAELIASEIPDENNSSIQYFAQRHILEYFASVGDVENFKKKIKPSKLGKQPRYGIENYKSKLLEGYAKKEGIHLAFDLAKEKYFENTAVLGIIRETAHTISMEEIDKLLEKYPFIEEQSQNARAWIYVAHFNNQRKATIPQNEFELTLNEILKEDRTAKCGDIRCIDCLLMDLFYATNNKSQAIEIKKHLVSPKLKSEFNAYVKRQTEGNKWDNY